MAEKKGGQEKKQHTGIYILPSLLEEIRDAAVFLSGPPTILTVTAFFESAARRELKHLKRRHNDDQDFPKRKTNPRQGRRVQ